MSFKAFSSLFSKGESVPNRPWTQSVSERVAVFFFRRRKIQEIQEKHPKQVFFRTTTKEKKYQYVQHKINNSNNEGCSFSSPVLWNLVERHEDLISGRKTFEQIALMDGDVEQRLNSH